MLKKDNEITFPNHTLVVASAGSGKTYNLTLRYVQFLLSEHIAENSLSNILAITFTNNAAREMKERILKWLKNTYHREEDEMKKLTKVLTAGESDLPQKAEEFIDHILDNYSDFEVKTIDSFLSSVFRASAIDFGYNPSVEILLDNNRIIDYAFDKFLRHVKENTHEAKSIAEVMDLIESGRDPKSTFQWDPSENLSEGIKSLYKKLASLPEEIASPNFADEIEKIKSTITEKYKQLRSIVKDSGLEIAQRKWYTQLEESINTGNFIPLFEVPMNQSPVKKGSRKDTVQRFEQYKPLISSLQEELRALRNQLIIIHSFTFYQPYVKFLKEIDSLLTDAKKEHDGIFIEDVGKYLATYLNKNIVPEIYIMLGDHIYHYLIDEFQDTSPIQWYNLFPLIENSLSSNGSLYVVGDTKQAIYTFRGADYRIMMEMEKKDSFSSAPVLKEALSKNWRSFEEIVDFNRKAFHRIAQHDEFKEATRRSGLDKPKQEVRSEHKEKGYVEIVTFDKKDENHPEKEKILTVINELITRGYGLGDIAILTFENARVTEISSWLSEVDIPFISFSNLDARKRKIIQEIIALLKFLNSPVDDHSFASFCLGSIMQKLFERHNSTIEEIHKLLFTYRHQKKSSLYKHFIKSHSQIWNTYFENLFNLTGYLPLYDLTTEIYKAFDLFKDFPEEEGALTKLLEVIKNFETSGNNSIIDFLDYVEDENSESSEWNISTPIGLPAITLMTIHKAKGLQFPVVIVLIEDKNLQLSPYILHKKDKDVYLLKITQKYGENVDELMEIYQEHRTAVLTDRLNALYVAFTRAKYEMYIIGLQESNKNSTISVLPIEEYAPQEKKPSVEVKPPKPINLAQVIHHSQRLKKEPRDLMPFRFEEITRGKYLHQILSSIYFKKDDIENEIKNIIDDSFNDDLDEEKKQYIRQTLVEFLSNKHIREYFEEKPNRKILNECEFAGRDGSLYRIDRLVIDPDSVTIMDYKTGEVPRGEPHREQINKYVEVIRDIYPNKKTRGVIAYVDANEVVEQNVGS